MLLNSRAPFFALLISVAVHAKNNGTDLAQPVCATFDSVLREHPEASAVLLRPLGSMAPDSGIFGLGRARLPRFRKYLGEDAERAGLKTNDYIHEARIYEYLRSKGFTSTLDFRGVWRGPSTAHSPSTFLEFEAFDGVTYLDFMRTRTFGALTSPVPSMKKALEDFDGALDLVSHLHTNFDLGHFALSGENFLVDPNGRLRISEFAAARIRRATPNTQGAHFDSIPRNGNSPYLAPELTKTFFRNDAEVDFTADVFSLGKILENEIWALWSARFMPGGQGSTEMMRLRESFFSQIIKKATHKDPKKRFQSVAEMKEAIRQWRSENLR